MKVHDKPKGPGLSAKEKIAYLIFGTKRSSINFVKNDPT